MAGKTPTSRAKGKGAGRSATGRYTPPIPASVRSSPRWMGPALLAVLILGALVIIVNYLGVLPGGASDWYLVAGIVLIAAGFAAATQYH